MEYTNEELIKLAQKDAEYMRYLAGETVIEGAANKYLDYAAKYSAIAQRLRELQLLQDGMNMAHLATEDEIEITQTEPTKQAEEGDDYRFSARK